MAFTCPKCKAEFFDRLKYCPECGFDFTAGQKRCPRCREMVAIDSETCPECGLDFEKFAFFVPRVVIFGSLAVIIAIILIGPWVWRSAPAFHDKGRIIEGRLVSEVDEQRMVPLFIHWRTGERYISESSRAMEYGSSTEYMNELIPLPPEVVFHYDMPVGERVWIIRRLTAGATTEWVQIGRWSNGNDKYGWVHASNIEVLE
jgi:hypothetical protein